jgi:hypothetical protein
VLDAWVAAKLGFWAEYAVDLGYVVGVRLGTVEIYLNYIEVT